MADFKLDEFGDLDLSSGDIEIVRGADAIAQHLKIRLRSVRGNWFLDQRVGLPYFKQILVKSPNLIAVRSIFRAAITSTPGVIELQRFDLSFDRSTRILLLNFSALLDGEDAARDFSLEFVA